ncbi:hypothetical protein HKBW3S03_01566 [Candidatus Hakubella thermalkaliphila]|uniref:Uncharacterized protein n=3 Tax=Candidatus Hakubella thermalkaliphila TaxID=2754717 RepID=A0A6V8PK47_9ACTN|nr:hypothetical protein HKBW3S03_01566 [Candidatus Hakubella thermalkaliphila]GFP31221.1 hypothetical protein HKBW3S34_02140 [Candidatus Hakubella thermalkaliphila]
MGIFIALSYAFLIGYGLSILYYHIYHIMGRPAQKMQRVVGKISAKVFLVSNVFLLCGVYVWPMWTGDVIYPGGKVIPSATVEVPNYYYQASDWLDIEKGDFRIVSIPLPKLGSQVAYSWDHGYVGEDPTRWLLPKTVVVSGESGRGISGFIFDEVIQENPPANLGAILNLFNARYILFHRDTD